MSARDDSPLALELLKFAASLRNRGGPLAPLAKAVDRFVAIERRLDRLETQKGLQQFLAAGGRKH